MALHSFLKILEIFKEILSDGLEVDERIVVHDEILEFLQNFQILLQQSQESVLILNNDISIIGCNDFDQDTVLNRRIELGLEFQSEFIDTGAEKQPDLLQETLQNISESVFRVRFDFDKFYLI